MYIISSKINNGYFKLCIKFRRLKPYFLGLWWFVLSFLVGVVDDLISKYCTIKLSSSEVVFFRYFFSTVTLIPFLIFNKENNKSNNKTIFIIRGILLFIAISGWTYGLAAVPLNLATTIGFLTPLFASLIYLLWKRTMTKKRWFLTFVIITGIVIFMMPYFALMFVESAVLIGSTIIFAILDIISKLYVKNNSIINSLFYTALTISILAIPFASNNWQMPNVETLIVLLVLGVGSNLISYCLLKAYSLVDVASLISYRYLEFFMSAVFGYIFFNEVPLVTTFLWAVVIIVASIYYFLEDKRLCIT